MGAWARLVRGAALLAVFGLLAAACGDDDDDTADGTAASATSSGTAESTEAPGTSPGTTEATVAPGTAPDTTGVGEPQSGGHLDVLLPPAAAVATSLDPARQLYTSGGGTGGPWYPWAVFGGLLVEDPVTGTVEPSLAESLETTDAGTTWELQLRDGLTFSDGTPFNAEAVKFNWDRISDPANAARAFRAIDQWESWTVTDPLTVTVVLEQPNMQFPRLVAQSFSAIGSPTAIAERGEDFGTQPVGAGPFVIDSFQPGTSLSVSRNPDYFDAPRPYLDSITFRPIADEEQRFRSFQTGEADFSMMLRPSDVARVDELDAHAVLTRAAIPAGYMMNTKKPPLDDRRVRQAFLLATDRSLLCQARNPGPPCGEEGSLPMPDWPFAPETPLHAPDVTFPATNLAAAQALIDEYRAEGGSVDVTLTIITGSQIASDMAQVLKSQLEQLDGVTLTIEQAGADFGTNFAAGAYQVTPTAISDASPYPALHEWFHSGGTLNAVTGFTTAEMDESLDRALALEVGDVDEARAAYNEVAQVLIDEALLIPNSYTQYGLVGRNSVHDITPHADYGVRWELLWLGSEG